MQHGETCIVRIEPFQAGLMDGLVNEVKGLGDFVVMAYDYIFKSEFRREVHSNLGSLDIGSIVSSFWEEKKSQYSSRSSDEIGHQAGSDIVSIVSTALAVKAAYSAAKAIVNVAVKGVGKLTSTIAQQIGKYTKDGYEIVEQGGKYFAKKGSTLIELGEDVAKGGLKFSNLPKKGFLNPTEIRFSQNSISSTFQDGRTLEDLITGLKNKTINPNDIPPIRIVEKDGLIYTLDNRRLKAFQEAGINIPYEKLDVIPEKEMFKFTTTNEGVSIEIRKGGYDGFD